MAKVSQSRGSTPFFAKSSRRLAAPRRSGYTAIRNHKRRVEKKYRHANAESQCRSLAQRDVLKDSTFLDLKGNTNWEEVEVQEGEEYNINADDDDDDDQERLPSSRFRTKSGNFMLPEGYSQFFSIEEQRERERLANEDVEKNNLGYILRVAEKCRGGLWKCKRDKTAKIIVGCRNYIVTLIFDDGVQWLLKVPQDKIAWSSFKSDLKNMRTEVATIRFVSQKTRIPVPKIHAWNLTQSKLGYGKPWYLMEKLSGNTLWKQLSIINQKGYTGTYTDEKVYRKIADQLALVVFQLLHQPFKNPGHLDIPARERIRGLKTLDRKQRGEKSSLDLKNVGDDVKDYYINPVDSFKKGLRKAKEILKFLRKHYEVGPKLQKKEDCVIQLIEDLLTNLLESPSDNGVCMHKFILTHGDLTAGNILVDKYFNITATIDWECADLTPLRLAYDWYMLDAEGFVELNDDLMATEPHEKRERNKICTDFKHKLKEFTSGNDYFYNRMKELDLQDGNGICNLSLPKGIISDVFKRAGVISAISLLTGSPNILRYLTHDLARECLFDYIASRISDYKKDSKRPR